MVCSFNRSSSNGLRPFSCPTTSAASAAILETRRTLGHARDNALAHCSPLHPLDSGNRYVNHTLNTIVRGISNQTPSSRVVSAADSIVFRDSETGFTFSQYNANYKYNSPDVISFRTAVPNPASAPYDIVLQVTAKKDVAWLGVAWGGTMLNNPLTMSWPNGNSVTVSSRWAKCVSQYLILWASNMMLTDSQGAIYAHCVHRRNHSSPQDRDQDQLHALAGDAEVYGMYHVDQLLGFDRESQSRRLEQAGLRVLYGRAVDAILEHIKLWRPRQLWLLESRLCSGV